MGRFTEADEIQRTVEAMSSAFYEAYDAAERFLDWENSETMESRLAALARLRVAIRKCDKLRAKSRGLRIILSKQRSRAALARKEAGRG